MLFRESGSCGIFFFWGRKKLIIHYDWLPEYLIWMGIGVAWLVCFSPSVEVQAFISGCSSYQLSKRSGRLRLLQFPEDWKVSSRKTGEKVESKTDTERKSYGVERREQSDLFTAKKVRIIVDLIYIYYVKHAVTVFFPSTITFFVTFVFASLFFSEFQWRTLLPDGINGSRGWSMHLSVRRKTWIPCHILVLTWEQDFTVNSHASSSVSLYSSTVVLWAKC